ncbi:MAG: cupin domain-containing protein [Bdellovibrionales bacterium]|nr:cupin domain-containing protein [Bdellovibrionales bacterium]
MGLPHAQPGQVINLLQHLEGVAPSKTTAIVKEDWFEVIRLRIRAGEAIPEHKTKGPITVQCLEGKVVFNVDQKDHTLSPNSWLYLKGGQKHSLKGIEDSLLLLTIVFQH